MRAVGIDLGAKRVGIAVTDAGGRLALPHRVVERSGDPARDLAAVADLVEQLGAEIVVVGLPLQLSGKSGPAARAAEAEAGELRGRLAVPVVTFDERLTTVEAARRRHERDAAGRNRWSRTTGDGSGTGGRRSRRGQPSLARSPARRQPRLDAEAAAIMLEAWLRGEA